MPVAAAAGGIGCVGHGQHGGMGAGGRPAGRLRHRAWARGGSEAPASSIPATFDTVKLVLMGGGPIMPCAAAPCHGVHGMAPPDDPLELPPNDDQQLYTNLTSYIAKDCSNAKLVDPGNPAQSALLTVLKGPCGMVPRMPYMCTDQDGNCIPDEYVVALAQWICRRRAEAVALTCSSCAHGTLPPSYSHVIAAGSVRMREPNARRSLAISASCRPRAPRRSCPFASSRPSRAPALGCTGTSRTCSRGASSSRTTRTRRSSPTARRSA